MVDDSILDLAGSIPIGVIIVSGDRQVVSMNRRAVQIAQKGDSFLIQNNLLRAARPGQTGELDKLIEAALAGQSPRGMIVRESNELPLWVQAVPLSEGRAAVLISDPEQRCIPDDEMLGALFGLTPAERRLASLLIQGASLREAAAQLQISLHTARTHLKVIFHKTGTNRQSRLMFRLLSATAAGFRAPALYKTA
jgi:DNA-binding CsgD family transcriptional regulator